MPMEEVCTHQFPLENFQDALNLVADSTGNSVKVRHLFTLIRITKLSPRASAGFDRSCSQGLIGDAVGPSVVGQGCREAKSRLQCMNSNRRQYFTSAVPRCLRCSHLLHL